MSKVDKYKCSKCGGHNDFEGIERLLCAIFGERIEKREPKETDYWCHDCRLAYLNDFEEMKKGFEGWRKSNSEV
jgi:DNA-directed RNA polymerase subunit RPC12/RpoP